MSNESTKKTVFVTLGVCFVCSILVSTAAVTLKGIQKRNQEQEKIKNILIAGDLFSKDKKMEDIYHSRIRAILVDLRSGSILPDSLYPDQLNPDNYDIKTVAKDPNLSRAIIQKNDLAQIGRMPVYMAVYEVIISGEVRKMILPIYGKGLWSTMYGFMALDRDLKTITGFTIYEQGETPGLGGEVDNPQWKKLWVGKKAFDNNWNVRIEVIKGKVDPTDPEAKYEIDGLSGSTLTTRGVDHMVKFWMGEQGYGPFLRKLRGDV